MQVQVKSGNLVGICDGTTAHEVFKQIASFQETFEDSKCGLCDSENLKFVVRNVDDNEFYELRCNDCHGKLSFGTSKGEEKKLYPKRFQTDAKGKAIKDAKGKGVKLGKNGNGWTKYNFETGKEE